MNRFVKIIFFGFVLFFVIKLWPKKQDAGSKEKVLHVALENRVEGLDPAVVSSLYETQLMGNIYEGLLEYHYLKCPLELIPNLAEAMPTVSKDGLTYTFTIKRGVYFHDNPCFPNGRGREVTAEDFVYSFKRIADPAVVSPYYAGMASLIEGFDAFHNHLQQYKGDYSHPIAGIQAIDTHTLQFRLKNKNVLFLTYLADFTYSVVAKEAVEYYGSDFMNNPVGTGPFILENFKPQCNKFVYVKNTRFRNKYYPSEASPAFQHLLGSAAGKKLPFVDKVIYHVFQEAQPRWLQFEEKKIDYIWVKPEYITRVFEEKALKPALVRAGITLLESPELAIDYIGLNCLQKPLDNVKLRQAMSLAFDRESYNQIFYANKAEVPISFIPSFCKEYEADFSNPYATYDLPKAKQYLAEAGYPGGKGLPSLTLDTNDLSIRKQQCEFFAQCMEKIGITVTVRQNTFPELLKKLRKLEHSMVRMDILADIPDAVEFFKELRYISNSGASKIEDKIFNGLYDQAMSVDDMQARTVMYAKLNARAVEMAPSFLCPRFPLCVLTHAHVKNYRLAPFHLINVAQYVDIT